MIVTAPIGVDRDPARERALNELLDPRYEHEPWLDRLRRQFEEFLDRLNDVIHSEQTGWLAAAALLTFIVALIALPLWRARRLTRRAALERTAVFTGRERTAAEHREEAERLAAAGEWAEAIRERLRAVARDLEERAILDPMPGRTAAELAADAGRELPGLADEFAAGARLFEDVTYGEMPGSAEGYARLVRLDEQVAAARPRPLTPVGGERG